jgi:hypothetical protein
MIAKRKRGRPQKDAATRKQFVIRLRVTDADRLALGAYAGVIGKGIARMIYDDYVANFQGPDKSPEQISQKIPIA